jgi:hypothetical protein
MGAALFLCLLPTTHPDPRQWSSQENRRGGLFIQSFCIGATLPLFIKFIAQNGLAEFPTDEINSPT